MKLSATSLPLQLHNPLFHLKLRSSNPLRLAPLSAAASSDVSKSLQSQTLAVVEWNSLCKRLSPFTSTSMGLSATEAADIPIGESQEESRRLLDQTAAAVAAMGAMESNRLDLSDIQDVSGIVESAVAGRLLSVGELCAVRRTLAAARLVFDRLREAAAREMRVSPLLGILQNCDLKMNLEQNIGFCIDCNLSIILDRASEDLEVIRAERKTNTEKLDSLLKDIATRIYQAGGIDKPLITKRRSRMCVGVRASRKYLLPDGVVLSASSSGATYFMEPKEALELNNMEVRLANSEKAEERTILSFLTSEVSESAKDILYLLDRFLEVDLAFARASYSQSINGVCPILSSTGSREENSSRVHRNLEVDIDSIRHPLLLQSSSQDSIQPNDGNGTVVTGSLLKDQYDFPVPIDIKINYGTKVVVISGPNTGGKTASLKTLGLASLMSKSGMYLPALNYPRLPWFDLILADIGDHQSLEQNLSTFSGHIRRICQIFEVASEKSLVLLDEICSGTDPSEGVALSTSILQYLKDRVNLTVVTTHYADLSRLTDNDSQFQNAAMEFSLETLQPTFRIVWGSTGDSNALSIAESIGFSRKIIQRAHEWVEKLRPEQQQERKGLLYQSLLEERSRLNVLARKAAAFHAEVMDLYYEIQDESEDLDRRERALQQKETQDVQEELEATKLEIQKVVDEFRNQLKVARADQLNSLIRKSETALASIVEAHWPTNLSSAQITDINYSPQVGERVHVKGLGDKIATIVEEPADDETVLVQYGKIKVRVKKSNIRPISIRKTNSASNHVPPLRRQLHRELQTGTQNSKGGEVAYGPRVQTSRNTVDLRGMRVEEAAQNLNMAIAGRESHSVLFVIHGMGTGAVKNCALEILRKHPRVARYEEENPMNYGCTVAYIN